jgi:hypothetical protein
VNVEMPAHWRVCQRLPMPRPTVCVPQRADTPRRTCQTFGLCQAVARVKPWRRATRLVAHEAMRLRRSQRQSPGLHTDSCQTHPLSRHARATRSMAIRYAASRSETCSRSALASSISCLRNVFNEPFTTSPPIARVKMNMPPKISAELRVCVRGDEALPTPLRAALSIAQISESAEFRSERQDGRCRCREASARIEPAARDAGRCDSRLRHRPDEGRRRTRDSRKVT